MSASRTAPGSPLAPSFRLLGLLLLAPLGLAASLRPSVGLAQDSGQATGIVRVTSPIPHATVYVDDEQVGEAPVVRYLEAGPHMVRVTADDHDPFVRRVDVTPGTTVEVAAQLLAGTGTVEFLVEPPSAKLVLNDGEPGPAGIRLRDLQPGEYRYRLSAPGYETAEGTFTFAKGKNLLFPVKLKSTRGLLTVASSPDHARVWLDGQSVGETPLSVDGLSEGAHVVRLELADHATAFRRFDNSDGSKGELLVTLPAEGASLAVDTGSAMGVLRLEGNEIGTGSVVHVPILERGRYHVEVSSPDHPTVEGTVDVPTKGHILLVTHPAAPGEQSGGTITRERPLLARWTFWGGVALGAGAVTTGSVLLANALTPEPVPESDTVVVLP